MADRGKQDVTASEKPKRRSPQELKKFMDEARERFRLGDESTHKQKERELADLAFFAGGDNQWDPDQLKARKAQQAASGGALPLPPVPARPVITINKIKEPVHQIQNEERLSDLTPELVAADDFEELVGPIDDTEIQFREGIVRRIQRAPEAEQARSWGFQRALICGHGYYVVMYRYSKGKTFDQEIYVHRIYNQNGVVLDPAHEDQTGADCEWGFIGDYMTGADYDAFHKYRNGKRNKIRVQDMNEGMWRALGDQAPGWFKDDKAGTKKKTRMVRVVHYWYYEREVKTLYQLADGSALYEDELTDDIPDDAIIDERVYVEKHLKWALLDGVEPIEEADWASDDFPIVKIVAEEMQPWDRERRVEGIVRQSRGAQMGFNAMVSKHVEVVGLAPIPPLLLAEGQASGWESWYQLSTTRTLPFLLYRAFDQAGRPLPTPTRPPVEAPIEQITVAVQMFDEAIKSTTMVPSVQLGQATDPAMKTARGIKLLQDAAAQSTSSYMDQLKHSVRREGEVINNLLYPIYGKRPGRMLRLLTGEGEKKTVKLAEPKPAPGPEQMDQGNAMPGAASGPKEYRLTENARFNVEIKVSKNTETRRQAAAQLFEGAVQAVPQAITWFGDLMFKYQDAPGAKEAAERMEVVLDPKIQSFLQQKKDSAMELPPEVMSAVAQMQGQLKHAEQIMQQAKHELETKQAEQQARIQVAQMETDRAIKLQAMKDATTLEVARITAAKAMFDTRLAFIEEQMALQKKIEHESTEAGQDRMHEHVQGALDRHHEKAMTEAQQQHDAILAAGDQGHESDLSAAQQAADAEEADRQRQHEGEQATQQQQHEASQQTQQQVHESVEGDADRQAAEEQAKQQGTEQGS